MNEIGLTGRLPTPDMSTIDLTKAKNIGHFDNVDVWSLMDQTYEVYFHQNNNAIIDFVIIGNQVFNGYRDLMRVHNINGSRGSITSIIMFLKNQGIKLRIPDKEELTMEGINWLIKIIDSGGQGLTITDQNDNKIDSILLKKEWRMAGATNTPGPTSIFIEGNINQKELLAEKYKGGMLVPFQKYIDNRRFD